MKHRVAGWKFLVPLILGILIMSVAFVLISYYTFRDIEIEDYENYARGLTNLIAKEIVDVEHVDDYIQQGRDYPGYNGIEQKLYHLRDAYPDVIYLYVYQFREDGAHVVFDLDTAEYKGTDPGTVEKFFPAFEKLIPDLLAGKPVPPWNPTSSTGTC